jgi:hypothetical protein
MKKIIISKRSHYKIIDVVQKLVFFAIISLILTNISFITLKFKGDITLMPGTNIGEVNVEYNILGYQLLRESNNSKTDDIRYFGAYLGGEVNIGGFLYFIGLFLALFVGNIWKYKKIKSKPTKSVIIGISFIIITTGLMIYYSNFLNLVNYAINKDQELKVVYSDLIYSYIGEITQNLIHFIIYPIIVSVLEFFVFNYLYKKIKSLKRDIWQEYFNKNFNEISIKDVKRLVKLKVKESNRLDYKEDYPKRNEKLAQLMISLANTEGGYIIIGIDEERVENNNTGIPNELKGVNRIDHETKLTNIALDNSEPKIVPNIISMPLENENNKDIIIVQIKKSIEPIMFMGNKAYYRRVNDQTRPANHEWVASKFLDFF